MSGRLKKSWSFCLLFFLGAMSDEVLSRIFDNAYREVFSLLINAFMRYETTVCFFLA